MNVRVANCTGFVERAAAEYAINLKESLDDLNKVKGIHCKYNQEDEQEKVISQVQNFGEMSYLSVLRGPTDVSALEIGDDHLARLQNAVGSDVSQQGVHLDLKNTQITSTGVKYLTNFLKGCPHLVTLGLDLANCTFDNNSQNELLTVVKSREHLKDFAFSVYGAAPSSEYFDTIVNSLDSMKRNVKFLRLSIANTNPKVSDLNNISSKLGEFDNLTDLELFLGGNQALSNDTAEKFVDLLQNRENLRNFELDIGYSNVNNGIVPVFGKHLCTMGKNLNRFGIYLNGLTVSKASINELVDLISNCNQTECYIEVKENSEMRPEDFDALKRNQTKKIKFATVVYADEEE